MRASGGPLLAALGAHALFLIFGLAILFLLILVVVVGRLLPAARPQRGATAAREE